nr:MAG TPA: Gifsy-2 prophage ATP-binding sugar transporter-like barrel, 4 helix bundle.7A [Caudoviricetes sp.]
MTFKDIIRNDIDLFVNQDEFADMHLIDGKEMPVMIDNNEQVEREKRMTQHMDGIYKKQMLIYVKKSDYGVLPAIGKILNLDGRVYKIMDAIDEDGIFSISLEANRS